MCTPGGVLDPIRENIIPTNTKIMHSLTVAIINKYFKLQNVWLKIIRIKYIYSLGNFDRYRCVKEVENFDQQQNLLGDIHQNLINSNLCYDATKHNVKAVMSIGFVASVVTHTHTN